MRDRQASTEGEPIEVIIADGHTLTRLGVKAFVEGQHDMRLAGETGEEEELLRLVRDLRPDLVILDVNLEGGGTDRFGICCRLKALAHPPRVLAHTTHDFTDEAAACLLAADAHLSKSARSTLFAQTIRRMVAKSGNVRNVPDKGSTPRLTGKEREIAAMMALRLSNVEIARSLHVSLPTVKSHVRSILRKLGAKNRKELFNPRRFGVQATE